MQLRGNADRPSFVSRIMRFWFLFITAAACAAAQPFSFGIKAGVPLRDFLDAVNSDNFGYFSTTNRYIIGPTAELHLPFGFGVEFDVLYRHFSYTSLSNPVDLLVNSSTTAGAWEFPLLAKYRFRMRLARPFVDAGVAWDTLSGLTQTISQTILPSGATTTSSTSSPMELRHNTVSGFVAGGGLDIHALVLHISPEIRYTYWGSQHFAFLSPVGAGGIQSNQSQFELLVGFTF
jgi:Outer membrane protein beta-barrel domain